MLRWKTLLYVWKTLLYVCKTLRCVVRVTLRYKTLSRFYRDFWYTVIDEVVTYFSLKGALFYCKCNLIFIICWYLTCLFILICILFDLTVYWSNWTFACNMNDINNPYFTTLNFPISHENLKLLWLYVRCPFYEMSIIRITINSSFYTPPIDQRNLTLVKEAVNQFYLLVCDNSRCCLGSSVFCCLLLPALGSSVFCCLLLPALGSSVFSCLLLPSAACSWVFGFLLFFVLVSNL